LGSWGPSIQPRASDASTSRCGLAFVPLSGSLLPNAARSQLFTLNPESVAELPLAFREVLILREFEDMSYKHNEQSAALEFTK